MSLKKLVAFASDKRNFAKIEDYINFTRRYLDFVFVNKNLQARIVSQNEQHYQFFQYKGDGHFNITRPINSRLMLTAQESSRLAREFLDTLDNA